MYFVESFPVGLFQCNCSLLINTETKRALVVDPGDEYQKILDRLEYYEANVAAIWHSHAHIDHIGATKDLFEFTSQQNVSRALEPPVVYLHEGDRWLYENVAVQAQMLGLASFEVASKWQPILEGQRYEEFPTLRSTHTPGHTPGSCCLFSDQVDTWEGPRSLGSRPQTASSKKVLFSGDTLFRRSIGRTDLWGGNHEQLLKSIRSKLFSATGDILVIPGHGMITTITEEKEKNPFLT